VLIGASGDFKADDGSGQSKQDHFAAMEDRLNAEFDIFHDFLQWNDLVNRDWPSQKTQALADNGHILLTNWKSPTGRVTDWAQIADGQHDGDIIAAANQVRDFGEPTFLTFYHEPEDNIRDAANGDAAKTQRYIDDYRNAFRHIVSVFEANGADNAIWVWDMQGWLGGFEDYYLNGLYPGDDVVDWVAWNPYNWYGCVNHGSSTKWKSFEDVVAPFYDWLEEGGQDRPGTDKPLMLGEWGSEENDGATNSSQTKAEWLEDARQLLPTRFPRLKAVVYFDTEGRRANGTVQFCEWAIDSSQSSMNAMTNLLTDPALNAQW
jgi:beta-mannanase